MNASYRFLIVTLIIVGISIGFLRQIAINREENDSALTSADATSKPEPPSNTTVLVPDQSLEVIQQTEGPGPFLIGERFQTVEGAPACLTLEFYREFTGYIFDKDNGALHQMIEAGHCILLKGGLTVIPERAAGWSGSVEVRVAGSRQRMVLNPQVALKK